ncbi:MAG: co-chaperone GroES family protein [Candidatus Moranbacteria bacterium]|jgi:co-chaperonin GroES (HSP10)|nr:co-chaperone GroES family protein [Candidatus Moranbacteria bacterium]
MKIQGNAILIKPDRIPERSSTGQILIPRSSKEMLSEWGTVVDIGPACKEVRQGMRVLFPRKKGSVIVIDGVDYFFVNEYHIKYME